MLLLPVAAEAQTTVWSGTLTVRSSVGLLGCSNGFTGNHCSVHLSPNEFTYDNTTYEITTLWVRTGRLELTLDQELTTATQALTLNLDGTAFAFEDADLKTTDDRYWNNSGLSWTVGETVSATLTSTDLVSDATLSALTVNDGTTDHTIDLTTTPYTVNVGNAVMTVTLTATPTHTGASVSAVTLGGTALADTVFTDGITVPSLAEGDNEIDVTVTAEDGGTTETYMVTVTRATSAATGVPRIRGTPQVGQTLEARKGNIADADGLPTTTFPLGYNLQWVRVEGTIETDIMGETGSTYSPTSSDVDDEIKVKVSFTDGAGNAETLTSDATAAVGCGGGGLRRRPARPRLVHDHDRGGPFGGSLDPRRVCHSSHRRSRRQHHRLRHQVLCGRHPANGDRRAEPCGIHDSIGR